MWNKDKVTVVLATKNNANTIKYVIEDLYLTGYVDDIIVIDTHSEDNTIKEVSYTKARLLSADSIKESINLGIERAQGNIVIFMDPEGRYEAQEIQKLLAYADSYDLVFASRTQDIGFRNDMAHFSHAAPIIAMSEKVSRMFGCPLITDIDSGVFLINRNYYLRKRFFLEYEDEFFFTEMLLRAIKNNSRFVQVPLEWRGDFRNEDKYSSMIGRMKFRMEINRIMQDKQARSQPTKETEQEQKQEEKKEQPKERRQFSPDKIVFKTSLKKPKQKSKKKSTKTKTKSSPKNKTNKKSNASSSILKKAINTTNRYSPDDFS
ncbi:MAG: glycosyltransferase family 2 protein [Candidatus Woesearchaeota archaeon]